MIIANKLKDTNRAEFLLYMWQVEDICRAYDCDAERIVREYVSKFQLTPEAMKQTANWYADLCRMMLAEGIRQHGHLQICKNILQDLEELNHQLIDSPHFPYYRQMYYKVLPYIVELRSKQGRNQSETPSASEPSEMEICFDVLYGVMVLRLQKREVSTETQKAVGEISTFLGQLSDYYLKNKKEPLEF